MCVKNVNKTKIVKQKIQDLFCLHHKWEFHESGLTKSVTIDSYYFRLDVTTAQRSGYICSVEMLEYSHHHHQQYSYVTFVHKLLNRFCRSISIGCTPD